MYQLSRWGGQEAIDSSDPEARVRWLGPPVPAEPLRPCGTPPHAQLPRGPRTRDDGGLRHPETRDANTSRQRDAGPSGHL